MRKPITSVLSVLVLGTSLSLGTGCEVLEDGWDILVGLFDDCVDSKVASGMEQGAAANECLGLGAAAVTEAALVGDVATWATPEERLRIQWDGCVGAGIDLDLDVDAAANACLEKLEPAFKRGGLSHLRRPIELEAKSH